MRGRGQTRQNFSHLSLRTRYLLIWLAIGAVLAAGFWVKDQAGDVLTGPARVVDGDSLWVSDTEIRLYGIDAVELNQSCMRSGRVWNCGGDAAQALRLAIASRPVTCRPKERDRYGRTIARCQAGGLDLAAAMIKGGFAVSFGAYEADEREARDARRGIWSSQFEPPGAWRARNPRRPQG